MPFIRLSDDYIDNPKFEKLSDGAFRLWHEALAYCRRHSTDGLFPFHTMRGFRHHTKARETQLSTPHKDGANPLWVKAPSGYQLHDYLAWNLSREEEKAERISAADRMRRLRGKRRSSPERSPERSSSRDGVTGGGTFAVRSGDGEGDGKKQLPESLNADARSKRPIFTGQRLTVFEWMFDDHCKILGNHIDSFDLHEWYFALDVRMLDENLIQPKRDSGAWIDSELVSEAQRRGISIRIAAPVHAGKLTTRLASALANIAREEQE